MEETRVRIFTDEDYDVVRNAANNELHSLPPEKILKLEYHQAVVAQGNESKLIHTIFIHLIY